MFTCTYLLVLNDVGLFLAMLAAGLVLALHLGLGLIARLLLTLPGRIGLCLSPCLVRLCLLDLSPYLNSTPKIQMPSMSFGPSSLAPRSCSMQLD